MNLEEIYDKVLEAYHENKNDKFEGRCFVWAEKAHENPFEEGSPARDLFFYAQLDYAKCAKKTIDCRRARVMFCENMKKIAELNLPNPYRTEQAEEHKVVTPEVQDTIQLEEPEYVLGVVPNQEIDDYTVQVTEAPEEKPEEPVSEPEPEKEPEQAPKKLFGRHKKR